MLIATHGSLGQALVEAAQMICGNTDGVMAVGFHAGQGIEDLTEVVRAALDKMAAADGTLCLVDLPGGSPARAIGGLVAERPGLELVCGVNLPMLTEVLMLRATSALADLAAQAVRAGHEGIMNLASLLRSELM